MATRAPAKKTTAAKKAAARSARQKDACDLLEADHRAVRKMFSDYRALGTSRARSALASKRELASRICTALEVHAQLEEEIFYPAARGALKDKSLLQEATVEHASARDLIEQLRSMDVSDELFDAKVQVLGEYVAHHIQEERSEMFPRMRQSRLNLVALREALEQRRQQLMVPLEGAGQAEPV